MKTLAYGEVLWDIYTDSEHIGGAPLNFGAHFKKCGGESWIVTAVGKDELGDKTIKEIEKLGINTDYVSYTDYETGKCLVTLNENKIPSYNLLNHVAYDYISVPKTNNTFYDVLYFGTLALRGENNRKVLKQIISENKFGTIFVDVNIRPPYYSEEVVLFACNNAEVLKISDEELPTLAKLLKKDSTDLRECAKSISADFKNLKMLIITMGEKGSFVYDCKNDEYYTADAEKVKVVSTVGAGDSFSAAFLAIYTDTDDIAKALELASKVSGYVVSCEGAVPDYEISQFK